MTEIFPAPWSLRGRGHVFAYRFSKGFLAREGVIPAALKSTFVGGLGALMLVDYTASNCGPYQELLLIPGSFLIRGKAHPSITRILVSTDVSVQNGRGNWGIPKALADFRIVPIEASGSSSARNSGRAGEHWLVRQGAHVAFDAQVTPTWFPLPFPLHTAFIPNTIAQHWEDQVLLTKVSAHGWARPTLLRVEATNGQVFPDLSGERPLFRFGLRARPFNMTFHRARLANGSER